MRAHRDELIQKGILLPDLANSTTSSTNASNTLSTIAGKINRRKETLKKVKDN
jgi:hypothetical protein